MTDLPLWLADQVDAAREHRSEVLAALGANGQIVDPAARERVLDRVEEDIDEWILAGELTCGHLRTPAPAFLPFGSTTLLCASCLVEYSDGVIGTPEDRRCDICGVEVTGPTIASLMVECGSLMVAGGACRRCRGVPE